MLNTVRFGFVGTSDEEEAMRELDDGERVTLRHGLIELASDSAEHGRPHTHAVVIAERKGAPSTMPAHNFADACLMAAKLRRGIKPRMLAVYELDTSGPKLITTVDRVLGKVST